ncbi:MAG: carbon-nitrogen hydrolase family protein [Deltaproteobacteria bacterium]|nr:carbon-nitrogen hydrolase family protein [Deltaproteobacteria bacterium]
MPLVAALQMNSGEDKPRNLDAAVRLVRAARARGAVLAGLPENFSWLGPEPERPAAAEALDGPTLSRMAALAREEGVALLAGSILETGAPGGRLYNTSVLFAPDGARLSVYRKIHLFDVEVGDGVRYRESDAVAAGESLACADTPAGRLGLSICYDLRFPELYRALADQGATLLAVPAAFTLMTGKDHWEVLLRARAIENQAWVMAPAQHGRHGEKRQTYGHALVADPWGLVVARASDGEGMALADADPAITARIRRDLPALQHRRLR